MKVKRAAKVRLLFGMQGEVGRWESVAVSDSALSVEEDGFHLMRSI